jgi:hypothetical protein
MNNFLRFKKKVIAFANAGCVYCAIGFDRTLSGHHLIRTELVKCEKAEDSRHNR